MNMLARDISDRNHRLGKDAKPEPVERPKARVLFLHVRPLADEHIKEWGWHKELQRPNLLAHDFIRIRCKLEGIDPHLFLSKSRKRYLVTLRKVLVPEVKARYPHLTSPQMGRLFHRDHTSILYLLGRTQSAKRRGFGHG